ncbi:hypothetical protein B0H19DRAFT_136495 [Mycena capillaripes]|nr:hypothetical protein B0H19DRAFT_136495 [Mycena capillaripes]
MLTQLSYTASALISSFRQMMTILLQGFYFSVRRKTSELAHSRSGGQRVRHIGPLIRRASIVLPQKRRLSLDFRLFNSARKSPQGPGTPVSTPDSGSSTRPKGSIRTARTWPGIWGSHYGNFPMGLTFHLSMWMTKIFVQKKIMRTNSVWTSAEVPALRSGATFTQCLFEKKRLVKHRLGMNNDLNLCKSPRIVVSTTAIRMEHRGKAGIPKYILSLGRERRGQFNGEDPR